MLKKLLLCLMAGMLLTVIVAGAEQETHDEPEPTAQATEAPEGGTEQETQNEPESAAQETESPEDGAPKPAKAYVLVTTATQSGFLPLPEEGEVSYPLRQILPDGTEAENIIHLTPDGVYMEDSTCANHDCVEQGMVTIENRKERILSNMIICLPNQVTLQLFTPEEVLEMVKGGQ